MSLSEGGLHSFSFGGGVKWEVDMVRLNCRVKQDGGS